MKPFMSVSVFLNWMRLAIYRIATSCRYGSEHFDEREFLFRSPVDTRRGQ